MSKEDTNQASEEQILGDTNLSRLYGEKLSAVVDAVNNGNIDAEVGTITSGSDDRKVEQQLVILQANDDDGMTVLAVDEADKRRHFNYGYALLLRRRVAATLRSANKSSGEILESLVRKLSKDFPAEVCDQIARKSTTYVEAVAREKGDAEEG